MFNEGYFYDHLIGASASHGDDRVSKNDATSNNGNKRELDKKSQREKGHQQIYYHEPKMDKLKDSERLTNDLLKTIEVKQSKINSLESKIDSLESQIKKSKEWSGEVAKRSYDITRSMAKVMETKGNFESVNDGLGKIDIAYKFSNVYDREWVHLSRWLAKEFPKKTELELIQSLTSLMKKCYKECIHLADEQLRQFMLLDESQSTPSRENNEELYAVRKQYAQTHTARSKMKGVVLSNVRVGDEMSFFVTGDKNEDTRKLIHEFLNEYIDCCWLMVVSNPPLALNFDVVGKQYCKEHFKVYSAKQRLIDDTNDTNTVREVVWPCVYYADKSLFCKKGDALLGTKDAAETSDDFGTTECTCFTTEGDKLGSKISDASQIKNASTCNDESSARNGTQSNRRIVKKKVKHCLINSYM